MVLGTETAERITVCARVFCLESHVEMLNKGLPSGGRLYYGFSMKTLLRVRSSTRSDDRVEHWDSL